MRLSVIEASDRLVDLINPDKPEVFEIEDPLMGPKVIYMNFQFDSDRHFSITQSQNKCSKSIFLLISYGGYISSFLFFILIKTKRHYCADFESEKRREIRKRIIRLY